MGLLNSFSESHNKREVKRIEKIVARIESLDNEMQSLSDAELKEKTAEFKERLASGETLDDILPEAFAVAREAAVRTVGMKPYHVQLIGGIVLHQGRIAEMKTGEGKTLVATLPVYLNALAGEGVHVVTVNDYLAKRDADWMGKIYRFLGLTVGCVTNDIDEAGRLAAYQADVTYGTNNEFGFDYLRDNMAIYKEDQVQRPLSFAIVDEVDSILIDEARTPLIISGHGTESADNYKKADRFVLTLSSEDVLVDEKEKQVSLSEEGVSKAEAYFGIENYSDPENMEINHHVQQALKAHYIMFKDIDYIVQDGEIIIVDEFTGRLMHGRRYSNGLHQAIEAKEHIRVRSESKTLATITIQNYFRMYHKLAGMTGTAKTEEDEFREIYNMDVVSIPPNKPVQRIDYQDIIFQSEREKFNAVVDRICEIHETGQPVLVGTISVEKSEIVSSLLKKRGIKHNVLNAKQHEKEAEIVAQAGRFGAVTIATNMAGRGTDILLGGNPEFDARKKMRKEGFSEDEINFAVGFEKTDDVELEAARETFESYRNEFKERCDIEHDDVVDAGGLAIIGTERHESRRIDNQLRGRAGRQGDPGKTQFFISFEDDLLRLFGGEKIQNFTDKIGLGEGEAIETGILTKTIEGAQKSVEGKNFGIRKYVLKYDDVMNKQREIIYEEREKVINGENLKDYIIDMAHGLISDAVRTVSLSSRYPEEWDFKSLENNLANISPLLPDRNYPSEEDILYVTQESLEKKYFDRFDEIYAAKEREIGIEDMREIERMILLRVVDELWMDHIDAMDQLRDGIGLRGIGQQDPVAAYAKEGFEMFDAMNMQIREDTVKFCCNITIKTRKERKVTSVVSAEKKEEYKDQDVENNAQPDSGREQVTYRRDKPKVGRNDPCPCGSGKKYKHCCGRNA